MKNWPVWMIMNDWNAGRSAPDLCRIYGFSSARACRARIAKWRKQGYWFILKQPGCPKKKRTQITAVWFDELTESESTTAGTIRQTGGQK